MAPLKVMVDNKLIQLNSLKSGKNTGKSTANVLGDAVETARVELAQELYGVLGNLMFHFRVKPSLIIPFFDITAIRNMEQTLWNRTLKNGSMKYLFTRGFVATDHIRLVNNSLFIIRFSMIENKHGDMGLVYYDLAPMTGISVAAGVFGPLTNHNMVVQNLGAGQAKFVLVII